MGRIVRGIDTTLFAPRASLLHSVSPWTAHYLTAWCQSNPPPTRITIPASTPIIQWFTTTLTLILVTQSPTLPTQFSSLEIPDEDWKDDPECEYQIGGTDEIPATDVEESPTNICTDGSPDCGVECAGPVWVIQVQTPPERKLLKDREKNQCRIDANERCKRRHRDVLLGRVGNPDNIDEPTTVE